MTSTCSVDCCTATVAVMLQQILCADPDLPDDALLLPQGSVLQVRSGSCAQVIAMIDDALTDLQQQLSKLQVVNFDACAQNDDQA